MTSLRRKSIYLFALSVLLLSATTIAKAAEAAEWNLLFYMDADCNLEEYLLENVEEMAQVGGDAAVNMLVLVDRHDPVDPDEADHGAYTDGPLLNIPNFTGAKIFQVEREWLTEVADWGEVNMGDPETLERFVVFAARSYPARRTMLLLSDHAGSWRYICGDDNTGVEGLKEDYLTIHEIGQALARATDDGREKIDLLAFDACLIGEMEAMIEVAPFCGYYVGSEATIPGPGYDYPGFLQALKSDPTMSAPELGAILVATYDEKYAADENWEGSYTLSLVDLGSVDAVGDAVNDLADACLAELETGGEEAWRKMAIARVGTHGFSRNHGYNLFDLKDLAAQMSLQFEGGEIAAVAANLQQAIDAAVLDRTAGAYFPEAHGMSIDFPNKAAGIAGESEEDSYAALRFAAGSSWLRFLDVFGVYNESAPKEILTSGWSLTQYDAAGNEIPTAREDEATVYLGETVDIRLMVDDPAFLDPQQCFMSIGTFDDEGAYWSFGTEIVRIEEDGGIESQFDGTHLGLADGENAMLASADSIRPVARGQYEISLLTQVRFADQDDEDDWIDAHTRMLLDLRNDTSKYIATFIDADQTSPDQTGESDAIVNEVELSAGDRLRPRFLVMDDSGEGYRAPEDPDGVIVIESTRDLELVEVDLDAGLYYWGVWLTSADEGFGFEAARIEYFETPRERSDSVSMGGQVEILLDRRDNRVHLVVSGQLYGRATAPQDIFFAIELPDGSRYYLNGQMMLTPAEERLVRGWTGYGQTPLTPLVDGTFTDLPPGTYNVYLGTIDSGKSLSEGASFMATGSFDI